MDTKLVPYIFFDGNAKQAIEFYEAVFGGKADIQFMKDVPDEVRKQAGDPSPERVMHAKLESGGIMILASDSIKATDKAAKIELSLMGSDESKLKDIFSKLSDGGSVSMPLTKQFWGDMFGMLTDKYGVDWMINISSGETNPTT